uniref:Uncharacterized protein n=1 Tax=Leersia perrieri TaxID=77586 RepID=A0A0D9VMG0_9ORYZ
MPSRSGAGELRRAGSSVGDLYANAKWIWRRQAPPRLECWKGEARVPTPGRERARAAKAKAATGESDGLKWGARASGGFDPDRVGGTRVDCSVWSPFKTGRRPSSK